MFRHFVPKGRRIRIVDEEVGRRGALVSKQRADLDVKYTGGVGVAHLLMMHVSEAAHRSIRKRLERAWKETMSVTVGRDGHDRPMSEP